MKNNNAYPISHPMGIKDAETKAAAIKTAELFLPMGTFAVAPDTVVDKPYVYNYVQMLEMFDKGAKWQKEHLWKPADGDDLPEIDREVIALLDNDKVVFAHRPNPNGWDAKSIITEKVERYIPETYDKGGWNIPDVKYWLDVLLPKEIEL